MRRESRYEKRRQRRVGGGRVEGKLGGGSVMGMALMLMTVVT